MASSQRQQPAQRRLTKLLEQNVITEGMYVRSHGDHLIVGRVEQFDPDRQPENRDRIRLTDLGRAGYGLSVKRHTGRWEKTPFSGSMEEMIKVVHSCMQHLAASIV